MSLETALENAAAAMNRLAAALESTRAPLPAVVPVVKTAANPAPIKQETAEEKPAEKHETAAPAKLEKPTAEAEKPAVAPAEKQKPAAADKTAKKAEKPAKTATPDAAQKNSEGAPVEVKKAEPSQGGDNGNGADGVKAELAENYETQTVMEFMRTVNDLIAAAKLEKAQSVALLKKALAAVGHDSYRTLPVEARGDVVAAIKAELGEDKMPW